MLALKVLEHGQRANRVGGFNKLIKEQQLGRETDSRYIVQAVTTDPYRELDGRLAGQTRESSVEGRTGTQTNPWQELQRERSTARLTGQHTLALYARMFTSVCVRWGQGGTMQAVTRDIHREVDGPVNRPVDIYRLSVSVCLPAVQWNGCCFQSGWWI